MSKSVLPKLLLTTSFVLALTLAVPVSPAMAKDGMAGFFSAMGGNKGSEFSGKVYDTDDMYEYTVAGLKMGMPVEEAIKILEERGYVGTYQSWGSLGGITLGARGGTGEYENKIDDISLKFETYLDSKDNTNRLLWIEFRQRFDTEQDTPTWKEKIKKRYGEEPSREEEFYMFYSDVPMLKSSESVPAACSERGGAKNTDVCKNTGDDSLHQGVLLQVAFPTTHLVKITFRDNRTLKKAMDEARAAKQEEMKEDSKNAQEGF